MGGWLDGLVCGVVAAVANGVDVRVVGLVGRLVNG